MKKLVLGVSLGAGFMLASLCPQAQEPDVRQIPRLPDGQLSFSGTPGVIGNWEGPPTGRLTAGNNPNPVLLDINLQIDEIPFQPWAQEVYDQRSSKDDPHTRCKPSGGPRMWHTPYGMEIIQLPEIEEIVLVMVGAPHSWRQIYMDGRSHPQNPEPSPYGHSIGHWDGDTLVVDSIGYTTGFWFSRGEPHTEQLHLIERISRPSFDKLRYEVTVDDPGAYTAPWTGGFYLDWDDGNEPFDYLCQENNLDPAKMTGVQ
jgi:hypothetical protein